mmetsp:Transcript_80349/g.239338  ORF Transcript_80349/g.239338 Transcript_80349/m.239338 type:complete len:84 (-) Transcript_80349:3-254(-)
MAARRATSRQGYVLRSPSRLCTRDRKPARTGTTIAGSLDFHSPINGGQGAFPLGAGGAASLPICPKGRANCWEGGLCTAARLL